MVGLRLILVLVFAFCFSAHAEKPDESLIEQRERFQKADYAFQKGRRTEGRRLSKKLKDYPLYPYLQYRDLRRYMYLLPNKRVKTFMEEYADTPLVPRIQVAWLRELAKKNKWETFLAHYNQENNTTATLKCLQLWAQIKTQSTPDSKTFSEIETLWVSPKSQPRACDKPFEYWIGKSGLKNKQVWARIKLSTNERSRVLTRYLARFLPEDERPLIDLWLKIDSYPHLITRKHYFKYNHPFQNEIISHGLKRLVDKDEDRALKAWQVLKKRYQFTKAQRGEITREIALTLALRSHDKADYWLKRVPDEYADISIREWRVRYHIHRQNWAQVVKWIDALPEAERQVDAWQYWRARAYEKQNRTVSAKKIYDNLCADISYYGLLACDRLKRAYPLQQDAVVISQQELQQVEKIPSITRARELFTLERLADARREWRFAMDRMDSKQQMAAAHLASSWAWHDRAIAAATASEQPADLKLYYPQAFFDSFLVSAKRRDIDPAWTFAIARQESNFISDARSHMGAIGLMQVLPSTATRIARETNTRYRGRRDLLNVEKNIHLGTAYLRKMYDLYQENPILATAAYNAGPHRVSKWLPDDQSIEPDIWIDTIPFYETRRYIKNVLTNSAIYDFNMGRKPDMKRRMKAIAANDS